MDDLRFKEGDLVYFRYDNFNDKYYYCKVIKVLSDTLFNGLLIDTNTAYWDKNKYKTSTYRIFNFYKIEDKDLINKLNKMVIFQ